LQGHRAIGIDYYHHPRRWPYRPQLPDSDRGSNVQNRRFSGPFILYVITAVGAVGILAGFTDAL
jgi:hypothetical protein